MTHEERSDLLELKAFLEKALPLTEQELIYFSLNGSKENYQFLIDKAIMYRETLKKINQQLEEDGYYERP
jgi:hypothetical protein